MCTIINKIKFFQVWLVLLSFLLSGCPSNKTKLYTITGGTKGTWEWIKTTSPTRTSTPQSKGYSQQLSIGTDQMGNVVTFFRNDSVQRQLYETHTSIDHMSGDIDKQSVIIQYGQSGSIKYIVPNGENSITLFVSEVLNPYTVQADTIQHLYQKSSKRLYPF
jgi:hypothetical protein